MDIKILTQPKLSGKKEFAFGEHLHQLLDSKRPKFTEASFFFGLVKDAALEKFSESIKSFILNGGDFKLYLGQPQKGNMKKVINSLLEFGCEVFVFNNDKKELTPEFQYKGAIFESKKKAILLMSTGNFTASGLYEGYNAITSLTYDLPEDNIEFETVKKSMFSDEVLNQFINITRENINTIFSTDIPSIEEFTRKDVDQTEPIVTSLNDINIDIEIDDNVDFLVAPPEEEKPKKEPKAVIQPESKIPTEPIDAIEFEGTKYFGDDNTLDIESMLFSASSHKANDVKQMENIIAESKPHIEETKIIAKTANLSKTSIFMLQLPKITQKGASAGEIKIPSYLRDLIPAFWGWPKEYSVKKNSVEKARICTFKIIDTTAADTVIIDENVKLFQREGENSFSILSEELLKLSLHENDIIRLIKTESADGSYFTCELIKTDADEYPIWEQFCTSFLKGSKRKYGMM